MPAKIKFTEEQINDIVCRYTSKKESIRSIAFLYGCSRCVIRPILLANGITETRWGRDWTYLKFTEAELQHIQKRYTVDCVGMDIIAGELGLSSEKAIDRAIRRVLQLPIFPSGGRPSKDVLRDGKKVCRLCRERKPISLFRVAVRRTTDGLDVFCRECRAKYDQNILRQHKYKINTADYKRLYTKQHGFCAICHQPETKMLKGTPVQLAIDHDHETGKVRGLLCSRCNLTLGQVGDSIELLESAIYYLRQGGIKQ
jgi:hypothetical protein